MQFNTLRLPGALRTHWFVPVALLVACADLVLARRIVWTAPIALETGIVLDLAVLVPTFYLLCYRRQGKRAVLRAFAMSCLGIWLAAQVVPAAQQALLTSLRPVRYAGMAVLAVLELRLALAIYKAAFGTSDTARRDSLNALRTSGTPDWVVRLMAWEAGLWAKTWQTLKRLVARR